MQISPPDLAHARRQLLHAVREVVSSWMPNGGLDIIHVISRDLIDGIVLAALLQRVAQPNSSHIVVSLRIGEMPPGATG